jgi:hypothetical protein
VLADREYLVSFRSHAAEPVKYRLLGDEAPGERAHLCMGLVDPATIDGSDATPPDFVDPSPDRYRVVTGP